MTIRKGSSYRDRPPHDKTEETRQFERELDNRTTELLPCPFCGGEARMLGTKERWFNPACSNAECGCEWTDSYATEAEAIAAWNARAERTCHDASLDSSTQFYCSECECTVDVPLAWGAVNYCPGCGARVKEGGDD